MEVGVRQVHLLLPAVAGDAAPRLPVVTGDAAARRLRAAAGVDVMLITARGALAPRVPVGDAAALRPAAVGAPVPAPAMLAGDAAAALRLLPAAR
jgi:hypothetical protein